MILVLSVVGLSVAFAGSAVADNHDADATLSDEEYSEVGDTVTVQLDVVPTTEDALAYEGGSIQIEYDSDSLDFVGGEGEYADIKTPVADDEEDGVVSIIVEGPHEFTDETDVSLTFEVTDEVEQAHVAFMDDSDYQYFAQDEEELDLRWMNGTISHEDAGSSDEWWQPYVGEDDTVTTSGLQDAISDWSAGDLDTGQLQDLLSSWSSGQSMPLE